MRQEIPLIVKSETVAKLKMFVDLKLKHKPYTNANTIALLYVTRNVAQNTRCFFHFAGDLGTRLVSAYPIVSVVVRLKHFLHRDKNQAYGIY